MKRRNFGIFYGITVILIVCVLCVGFFACDDPVTTQPKSYELLASHDAGALYDEDWAATKNKAIIFIPGLMASALFKENSALSSKDCVWGSKGFVNLVGMVLSDGADKAATYFSNQLMCDADGTPITRLQVGNMKSAMPYDSFAGMSHTYKYIKSKGYEESYDMLVWQYDWRQSIRGAGTKLQEFIDSHNYENVIFVTHSMGGMVVADYLSRSEANRSKVELFIPYSAPFLGSLDTFSYLFTTSPDITKSTDFLGMMLATVQQSIPQFNLTEIAHNIASVYQLIPYQQFNNALGEGKSVLNVDGEAKTIAELVEIITGFDFTKGKDGNTKLVVSSLLEYQQSMFINGKHVSTLVPTEYVVGMGIDTVLGVNTDADYQITSYIYGDGDGTVPTLSGSAGLYDGTGDIPQNVHVEVGISHGPIANAPDASDPGPSDFYSVIDAILSRLEAGTAGTN